MRTRKKQETVENLTYYVVQTYRVAGRNGISADDLSTAVGFQAIVAE